MAAKSKFGILDWLLILVVLVVAGGARAWYLSECAKGGDASPDEIRQVQGDAIRVGVPAASPMYDLATTFVRQQVDERLANQMTPNAFTRWLHVGMGALTAALFYGLARRAFQSTLVALLAGLFYAFNPFSIINTAELQDGTAISFLMALALASGARLGQVGGALTSVLYGLALAALVLMRLTLFPFAIVAVLWFLWRSQSLKYGWLYAILTFLCFGGGLASWMVNNHQETQNPLPIVDTTWWHVYIGNNPKATGGPFNDEIKDTLTEGEWADLQAEKSVKRYEVVAQKAVDEVTQRPFDTVERRLMAAYYFFSGKAENSRDGMFRGPETPDDPFPWLNDCLYCTLYGMLLLGFLGWRWTYGWRYTSMPLQLAILWVPLPYILGHAEALHGPRLPLDGPMLCLAAFAVCCFIPGLGGRLFKGLPTESDEVTPA